MEKTQGDLKVPHSQCKSGSCTVLRQFFICCPKLHCLAKMRLNSIQTFFYSCLLLAISPPVVSQTVSPGPTHDCSNQLVYVGDLACNNDLHNCCGATETCCAGGCCSLSEVCVFQGTANEACCPMGDPTFCGEPAAVSCLLRPCHLNKLNMLISKF